MTNKNWLDVLAQQCASSSQNAVAKRLSVSSATISLVLKQKYSGDIGRIQKLVEGAFMQFTVNCPVVGEIAKDRCLNHQAAPFASTNPQRVSLYKACRGGCSHSALEATVKRRIPVQMLDETGQQRVNRIKRSATNESHYTQLLEQELIKVLNK